MTIANGDETELELCADRLGHDRDWPLSFRWRSDPGSLLGLDLLPARNLRCQEARNAVLTEAKVAAEVDRSVSYSRRKEFYADRRRYHGSSFTYGAVLAAVADGVQGGLLAEERARPGSRGRQSRFRATPLLSEKLKGRFALLQPHEVLWLRDHDRKLIDYVDTERTRQMRKEVESINDTMASIVVELTGPDIQKVGRYWVVAGNHLLPTPPRVHRVFNRASFDKGGRLYGWWQGLQSRHRAMMKISGEAVLEPDYAQLHAQIVYALREIPLVGDAYETGHFPRDYGKKAFNIALNAKNQSSAVAAIAKDLKIERTVASKLLAVIMSKHWRVADAFCSDAGVALMRIDSDITLRAVKDCQAEGISALPVHDSLIVQGRHADRAAEIMIRAFATYFPAVCSCEVRMKNKIRSTDGRNTPLCEAA